MFGALFWKECRQVLKSLVYYIYVVVFVLFMTSQMSSEGYAKLQEPVPGQSYYGRTVTKDEAQIMEGTLTDLLRDVLGNSFATYPLGFYKRVTLTDSERKQAEDILERCTGKSFEALAEEMISAQERMSPEEMVYGQSEAEVIEGQMDSYKVPVKEGLTYEEFEAAMEEICRIVGKGSSYEKSRYENSTYVPMTYEQAREEFDALCEKDRLTRAYMRLFCDYAGIVLAILPIFVGVSRVIRDKRAKVQQVMFSKPASGAVIVVSRYLANLVMLCIPVFVTAFLLQQPFYYKAETFGIKGDFLAFFTVPGVWLLPEIMIVLALSFLITEFTDSILAVFVQVVWGIGSLFGATTLVGDFGMRLVARWNTLGKTALFSSLEGELLRNRGYYILLAIVCVALTVLVYERKRERGETVYGKIRKTDG